VKKPVVAVVFDLDGTLYRQKRVQLGMLGKLVWAGLSDPIAGARRFRVLSAYRRSQEELRKHQHFIADLEAEQLAVASRRCGAPVEEVESVVAEWMHRRPLPLLGRALRKGTAEFLDRLKTKGLRLAVFSDYPAEAKLEAMGIRNRFDEVVCAQEPEIRRFKPDPRGLEVVLERLGVDAEQAIYVGDRPKVDGEAARRAGMDAVIVTAPGWDQVQMRLALRGTEKAPSSQAVRSAGLSRAGR
jgi:putative hydrolase of the HAD superfamily